MRGRQDPLRCNQRTTADVLAILFDQRRKKRVLTAGSGLTADNLSDIFDGTVCATTSQYGD